MSPRKNIYTQVDNYQPARSCFDLSYKKIFTCDVNQLIPVMCDEVVPGDFFKIGNQAVVRMMPMVAPCLTPINMYVHYFFVPYRLLQTEKTKMPVEHGGLADTVTWEEFITGGDDGAAADWVPEWDVGVGFAPNSLGDYMGFICSVDTDGYNPTQYPLRAYNLVWNEYYRDETTQAEVALNTDSVALRNAEKDYFTTILPWAQRAVTAPSIGLSGTSSADWAAFSAANLGNMQMDTVALKAGDANTHDTLEANTVDLSTGVTFDIHDLRLAFQIQEWMERNARGGARYTEFLKAHFSVAPRDERLDRPEYIGGSKCPIIVSEVLQTSETNTTPQGTLAGHGIGVNLAYCGKYHVKEYGLILGLMSIMPKLQYCNQGINRQWRRMSRYEYFFPEFVGISEQEVETGEIVATAVYANNVATLGYQGRFDEMRTKVDQVTQYVQANFLQWVIPQFFLGAPGIDDLIKSPDASTIFADDEENGFLVSFGNAIKAWRPIPIMALPGAL